MTLEARIRRALRRRIAELAVRHGAQGWWPVRSERHLFKAEGSERHERGYHPGEFELPQTRCGRWEIVTGAVLTQNTAWSNVERALHALASADVTTPEALLATEPVALGGLVRPAGYFNQKSRYLRALAEWFIDADDALSRAPRTRAVLETARPVLLAVRGVGRETADSILLYAYRLPTFVIDAYTRRVLTRWGLAKDEMSYELLRTLCESALAVPIEARCVEQWQEAHALLVEEAKTLRTSDRAAGRAPRVRPDGARRRCRANG